MNTVTEAAPAAVTTLQPSLLLIGAITCASLPSLAAARLLLALHRPGAASREPFSDAGLPGLETAVNGALALCETFLGEQTWSRPLQTRFVVAVATERTEILGHASSLAEAHRWLHTVIATSPRDDFGHRFAYDHISGVMADGLRLRRHLTAQMRLLLTAEQAAAWGQFLKRLDDHIADHVSSEL